MSTPALVIRCPECSARFAIRESMWNSRVRCRSCGYTFVLHPLLTPPVTDPPVQPEPTRRGPRLTGPHLCPNPACSSAAINQLLGHRVSEFYHEECLRRSTFFAANYRCPHCLIPTFLESPRWQWGHTIKCPFAEHEIVVPNATFLLQEEEGERFAFECPACHQYLQVAAFRAGEWGICCRCELAIKVPPGGTPLVSIVSPGATHKRPDAPSVRTWTCLECGRPVPLNHMRCLCQRPL